MAAETLYSKEKVEKTFRECRYALKGSAFDPAMSRGRRYQEDRDSPFFGIMDPFELDTWKIRQSKAHRRAGNKTQVLACQTNDHIRSRLNHEEEVGSNATLMARILGLNVHYVSAVAEGHDDWHFPFGHIGEVVLSELASERLGYPVKLKHEKYALFGAQHIERNGRGLNLMYETLVGIGMHSRNDRPINGEKTMINEIELVVYNDKLSYLFADYNDIRRHPRWGPNFRYASIEELGRNQTERVQTVMAAILEESARKGRVSFSEGEVFEKFEDARLYMWKNVYNQIDWDMHASQLKHVYGILDQLFGEAPFIDPVVLLSIMTDKDIGELIEYSKKLRRLEDALSLTSAWDIIPSLYNRQFNYLIPDLDWAHRKPDEDREPGTAACLVPA
ncbi:hypothetical protein KY359_05535 [Candidatus Woesearchaeota archaeon]|nr:hypothetical protein [Candidatus Woesearchaeota archaeon]